MDLRQVYRSIDAFGNATVPPLLFILTVGGMLWACSDGATRRSDEFATEYSARLDLIERLLDEGECADAFAIIEGLHYSTAQDIWPRYTAACGGGQ